ncbi:MAG: cytochrome c family protein [Deltaproteobacteria bacterium]|nr:cytochrome c family protein [Deltaproteobacteria bacterium]
MKRIAFLMGIVTAAALGAGLVVGGEIPGRIELKVYPKKPVVFDHRAHAKRIGDCQKCHHKSEPGYEEKCSECHLAKKTEDAPSFRTAMHMRCKNCHMKSRRKVKGHCKECHPGSAASRK